MSLTLYNEVAKGRSSSETMDLLVSVGFNRVLIDNQLMVDKLRRTAPNEGPLAHGTFKPKYSKTRV